MDNERKIRKLDNLGSLIVDISKSFSEKKWINILENFL